ncbi:hypothetical protein GA0115259_1024213 [Streptomyces sp. MnatMP-M17]|nr:hypothetical protein GA0115259_1024213 [Streptomyces sp. MnatMP-M17]
MEFQEFTIVDLAAKHAAYRKRTKARARLFDKR